MVESFSSTSRHHLQLSKTRNSLLTQTSSTTSDIS